MSASRLVYLDNAATSWPKPPEVSTAMLSSVSLPQTAWRSTFSPGDQVVVGAQDAARTVFGDCDVVFTLNCTHAALLAARSLSLARGDAIITSDIEHRAVTSALADLPRHGIHVITARSDGQGLVTPDALLHVWQPSVKAVFLTHASNVLGAVNDLPTLSRLCHDREALLLADVAQTAGEIEVSVDVTGADVVVSSGHKGLLGPSGVGILCFSRRSEMLHDRASRTSHPMRMDVEREGGTPNLPGLAGFAAAVGWRRDNPKEHGRGRVLLRRLLAQLRRREHIVVYGPTDWRSRAALVSFNVGKLDPALVGEILRTRHGIVTRTGLHCAEAAHHKLGTYPAGTVRVSPGPFNTAEDIDLLLGALDELRG